MCKSKFFKIDAALLVARIGFGGLMLFHGIAKISSGIDGIKQMLVGKGLPEMLAYGVYVGEVVVPVLLILGIATRPAAAIFVINMIFAIGLAHADGIFAINATGGWAIEFPMLYVIGGLVLFLAGSGRFSLPCPLARLFGKNCENCDGGDACCSKAE